MATKLTGRTRHRIQTRMFGAPLLVLQVEEAPHEVFVDHAYGGNFEKRAANWRDANVEDLSELPR